MIFIIKNKKAKNMATQKAFSSILDDKDFVDQSWNILDSTEQKTVTTTGLFLDYKDLVNDGSKVDTKTVSEILRVSIETALNGNGIKKVDRIPNPLNIFRMIINLNDIKKDKNIISMIFEEALNHFKLINKKEYNILIIPETFFKIHFGRNDIILHIFLFTKQECEPFHWIRILSSTQEV